MDDIIIQVKEFIEGSDRRQLLILATYVSAFFCFPFTICAFVVAGTANAGFNAVFTAFLNIAYTCEAYYILNISKTPIAVSNDKLILLFVELLLKQIIVLNFIDRFPHRKLNYDYAVKLYDGSILVWMINRYSLMSYCNHCQLI